MELKHEIHIALFVYTYRVVRHIFLCLKQIVDVMLILLYLVAIFALMGESCT